MNAIRLWTLGTVAFVMGVNLSAHAQTTTCKELFSLDSIATEYSATHSFSLKRGDTVAFLHNVPKSGYITAEVDKINSDGTIVLAKRFESDKNFVRNYVVKSDELALCKRNGKPVTLNGLRTTETVILPPGGEHSGNFDIIGSFSNGMTLLKETVDPSVGIRHSQYVEKPAILMHTSELPRFTEEEIVVTMDGKIGRIYHLLDRSMPKGLRTEVRLGNDRVLVFPSDDAVKRKANWFQTYAYYFQNGRVLK